MSSVARRFTASPDRISSETWTAITKLICGDDKTACAEFGKVAGIAASLINDGAFGENPMVLINKGPRLKIYCLYGEDAITGEARNESELTWRPTAADWTVSLPCLPDDFAMMQGAIKGISAHFYIYDVAKGLAEEDEQKTAAGSVGGGGVDWAAFKKS
jgi:hypothetical protein